MDALTRWLAPVRAWALIVLLTKAHHLSFLRRTWPHLSSAAADDSPRAIRLQSKGRARSVVYVLLLKPRRGARKVHLLWKQNCETQRNRDSEREAGEKQLGKDKR